MDRKHEIEFIAMFLYEWPSRPSKMNSEIREEAIYVSLEGNCLYPFYFDDPDLEYVNLCGITKQEFIEAKKRIAEMKGDSIFPVYYDASVGPKWREYTKEDFPKAKKRIADMEGEQP